ncbi:exonuclease SbcC [Desulfitispora alkaliphila]|uniref:AAA family ATPase n=1 Tax=Desulfitispora alkaliphila TaxID=622674 RepID=UPI003D2590F3
MRPLKVSVAAFGPYVQKQELDFRDLGERNIFLIHGPTGSGKTTLVDAMCFALYGDTSGAERDGRQMRSQYADASVTTEVEFEFQLGEHIFCVKRLPEQERTKKRGSGVTVQNAEATLWKLEEDQWKIEASGWKAVTDTVEMRLGFTSEQFRQVVVLPQGQFRKLLMADSKERQQILEKLFRTEHYRYIEAHLKESAKEIEVKIKDMEREQEILLQQVGCVDQRSLQELNENNQQELKELLTKLNDEIQKKKSAEEKLHQGREIQAKFQELKVAERELKALKDSLQAIQDKKQKHQSAQKAAQLVDGERNLKARVEELEEVKELFDNKKVSLEKAQKQEQEASKKLREAEAREPEREELKQKLTELGSFVEAVAELGANRLELTKQETTEKAMKTDIQAKTGELNEVEDKLKQLESELEQKKTLATSEQLLQVQVEAHEKLLQKRQSLIDLEAQLKVRRQELGEDRKKLDQLKLAYDQAKSDVEQTQAKIHSGQAAILSRGLEEEKPCPVCGSLEHPNPARYEGDLPSEEELQHKQEELERAEEKLGKAKEQLDKLELDQAKLEGKVIDLKEELGEDLKSSIAELKEQLVQKKELWSKARNAKQREVDLTKEYSELKAKGEETKKDLESLKEKQGELNSSLSALKAVINLQQSKVPEELQDDQVLKDTRKKVEIDLNRIEQLLESSRFEKDKALENLVRIKTEFQGTEERLKRCEQHWKDEQEQFERRLTEVGFADYSEFQQAKLTQEQLKLLEQEIQDFEHKYSAAQDRQERAVVATANLEEPDLEKLLATVELISTTVEQLTERRMQLGEQVKRQDKCLMQLETLSGKVEKLEREYGILGHLADVANGKNPVGVTFQRFVLGALLDDVTVAATERLKLMSKGRYHLQRTMDRAHKRAAAGLNLEVFDNYTGQARSIATLSGGESFLASLALALGLADVVQNHSGGVYLDAIFIDEGFGTLDPETLDFAMKALIDLQQGGRLVGIISHVPELRERIDARLEVVSESRGSRAGFRLGR